MVVTSIGSRIPDLATWLAKSWGSMTGNLMYFKVSPRISLIVSGVCSSPLLLHSTSAQEQAALKTVSSLQLRVSLSRMATRRVCLMWQKLSDFKTTSGTESTNSQHFWIMLESSIKCELERTAQTSLGWRFASRKMRHSSSRACTRYFLAVKRVGRTFSRVQAGLVSVEVLQQVQEAGDRILG